MSVSEQARDGLTQLVERSHDHYVAVLNNSDLVNHPEHENEASIIEDLTLQVKNLQIEVDKLGRQLEDVCSKLTR